MKFVISSVSNSVSAAEPEATLDLGILEAASALDAAKATVLAIGIPLSEASLAIDDMEKFQEAIGSLATIIVLPLDELVAAEPVCDASDVLADYRKFLANPEAYVKAQAEKEGATE